MIATRPDIQPDGYYNITQAAQALEVNRHTISRWIDSGVITIKFRKVNMRRVIQGKQLLMIWEKCL